MSQYTLRDLPENLLEWLTQQCEFFSDDQHDIPLDEFIHGTKGAPFIALAFQFDLVEGDDSVFGVDGMENLEILIEKLGAKGLPVQHVVPRDVWNGDLWEVKRLLLAIKEFSGVDDMGDKRTNDATTKNSTFSPLRNSHVGNASYYESDNEGARALNASQTDMFVSEGRHSDTEGRACFGGESQ
eukprot:623641_1